MELRDYQVELAKKGHEILAEKGIVYLAMEVRTGKTLTALEIARLFGAKNVLFLTKKKAISSITNDYQALMPGYSLTVINDQSLHKVEGSFDLVIHDEHHRHGAMPKSGQGTKLFRELFYHTPQIWLSGTPCPESYSQIYHQFWVSKHSPFPEPNFYKWAHKYVNIKQRVLPQGTINDYSDARLDEISPVVEPYMIRFTQEQAGFVNQIEEEILWVPQPQIVKDLTQRIIADGVVVGKSHTISADGAAALQQKVHQIHSGTILFDPVEGEPRASMTLSNFKVDFIRDRFAGQKIVIFHKFIAEGKALLTGLGDTATNDIDEFRSTDKSIVLQIVSGREGIALSEAEAIVFCNIDFASLSYWQSRDRLTTMKRRHSKVYWVFGEGGIEEKIYHRVLGKKDYTLNIFKKDFGISNARARHPSKSNPQVPKGGVLRSTACASQ
ncbi:MAG: hypothetical protein ACRC62_20280 [Microcoleus sp.]